MKWNWYKSDRLLDKDLALIAATDPLGRKLQDAQLDIGAKLRRRVAAPPPSA